MNQPQSSFKANFSEMSHAISKQGDNTFYVAPSSVRNICFRWQDGKRQFFNYAYLVSIVLLTTENSKNELSLQFTSHVVVLTGYRLGLLFKLLMDHLPREVPQTDVRYLSGDSAEFCVADIVVKSV